MHIRSLAFLSCAIFGFFSTAAQKTGFVLSRVAYVGVHQSSETKDIAMESFLKELEIRQNKIMDDTLALLRVPLTKSAPESTLGNFTADALAQELRDKSIRVDICVLNYGLIGKEYIAPGALKKRILYEWLPHDDALNLVTLTGKQLCVLCDSIAAWGGCPTSGIRFTIKEKRAEKISVNGKDVHPDLLYSLLTTAWFVRVKLLGNEIFKDVVVTEAAPSVRACLRKHLATQYAQSVTIVATLDGRISYAE